MSTQDRQSPLSLVPIALLATLAGCDATGPGSDHDRGGRGKADLAGSCSLAGGDSCGSASPDGCYCDDLCLDYGDCCADKVQICDGGDGPIDPDPPQTACLADDDCQAGSCIVGFCTTVVEEQLPASLLSPSQLLSSLHAVWDDVHGVRLAGLISGKQKFVINEDDGAWNRTVDSTPNTEYAGVAQAPPGVGYFIERWTLGQSDEGGTSCFKPGGGSVAGGFDVAHDDSGNSAAAVVANDTVGPSLYLCRDGSQRRIISEALQPALRFDAAGAAEVLAPRNGKLVRFDPINLDEYQQVELTPLANAHENHHLNGVQAVATTTGTSHLFVSSKHPTASGAHPWSLEVIRVDDTGVLSQELILDATYGWRMLQVASDDAGNSYLLYQRPTPETGDPGFELFLVRVDPQGNVYQSKIARPQVNFSTGSWAAMALEPGGDFHVALFRSGFPHVIRRFRRVD